MQVSKATSAVVAALFVATGASLGQASTISLSLYYPNAARFGAGYYLEGTNNANPQAPTRSVLWFQSQGGGAFKQFNSAPYDTCHWDLLSWSSGTLVYSKTRDQCGSDNNEVDYSPGVKFMPNALNTRQTWTVAGSSAVVYIDHGRQVCKGTDIWSSRFVGSVTFTATQQALLVQNNQSTYWKSGSDPSGCAAGYVTRWQENFYLVSGLPVQGSTSTDFALARENGGNIDSHDATGQWDYDVWYSSWNRSP